MATARRSLRSGVRAAGRRLAWRCRCDLLDALDALAGRRDPLTPPRRMWEWVAGRHGDFARTGVSSLELLRRHGLSPDDAVLDVGCGVGRIAVPLTGYLGPAGSYDGLDVMPAAIAWCRRAITPRFPRFRFHLADVRSDRYRPDGPSPASRYVFPFPDESFDFVCLWSVFTHMLPADMRNYLAEIARVMRPGARCVISYFLLDERSRAAAAKGRGAFRFRFAGEGYWAEDASAPEAAIAFERADIEALYASLGLKITAITPGAWSREPVQDQDLVAAVKPAVGAGPRRPAEVGARE